MASLREQLVGAWELVSYSLMATDGTDRIHPLGQEPRGTILYSACGYMSAQLMRPGRTKFVSSDWSSGTPAEYKEQSAGYLAFSGRFEADELEKVVKHHVLVSMFPNWEGQIQVRKARVEGEMLVLGTESAVPRGNASYMAEITWKRVQSVP